MIHMNFTVFNDPTTSLAYIMGIIIIAFILTRVIAFLMNKMNRFKKDMTAIYLIRDIIDYVIYFIALMTILQLFGINLAGTLLSLGIVGIAVSFAAKDIISNLFSGIILILGRSIKVGDTLEINNKKGYVEKISLRSTVIVDDLGIRNVVPNSTLTNNAYLKFKKPEKYRADIIAGISLDNDIEEFKEYIIKKMESYTDIAETPRPQVFAKEITFEESRLKVSFWVNNFNDKEKYKIIITNEIRKYVQQGEKHE